MGGILGLPNTERKRLFWFLLLQNGVAFSIWKSYYSSMTLQDLIDVFGSQANVARRLGVDPASVCEWAKTGVPDGRQYQAQLITNNKLKAAKPADRCKADA